MRRFCTAAVVLLLVCSASLPHVMAYSIQQAEDQASIDALGSDPIRMQTVSSKQVPHQLCCLMHACRATHVE